MIFQPTLPQGERPVKLADDLRKADISTHAPARGATTIPAADGFPWRISTHAPARGATKRAIEIKRKRDISTHAPARGATTYTVITDYKPTQFQPTLPQGERHTDV